MSLMWDEAVKRDVLIFIRAFERDDIPIVDDS